jgi:hypothetical protein
MLLRQVEPGVTDLIGERRHLVHHSWAGLPRQAGVANANGSAAQRRDPHRRIHDRHSLLNHSRNSRCPRRHRTLILQWMALIDVEDKPN